MDVNDFLAYNHPIHKSDAVDVFTPADPFSKMRTLICKDSGLFRVARRTCSVYSVEIKSCGSWGRVLLFNEDYDIDKDWERSVLFCQPSTFTGSFVLEGCAWGGLYLLAMCGPGSDLVLTVNYREPDAALV